MIIAKPQELQPQEVTNEYYELFQPAKAIGMDGEEIDIMQSIGQYSISQLNNEKQNYLNAITLIDEKIAAIELLK